MRYKQLISGAFLLWTCIACSSKKEQAATVAEATSSPWDNYYIGKIGFENLSPETKGSAIYAAVIPDPEAYITKHARKVVETLYFTPEDSIPGIEEIHYTLKEYDGVSAKDGAPPSISIVYSTKWIEKSFANNDTAKVDYETRGVLYHELTHGFQLEPQGIGSYGTNKTFWAMIEGVADAVRYLNGGFTLEDRPKGGPLYGWLPHDRLLPRMAYSNQEPGFPAEVQPKHIRGYSLVVRWWREICARQ